MEIKGSNDETQIALRKKQLKLALNSVYGANGEHGLLSPNFENPFKKVSDIDCLSVYPEKMIFDNEEDYLNFMEGKDDFVILPELIRKYYRELLGGDHENKDI